MGWPRASPYHHVEVRGLHWEGHDHNRPSGPVRNADQELGMVLNAFHEYGHRTMRQPIPRDGRARSEFPVFLRQRLNSLVSTSGRTLIVLYYQGHGGLDHHGHLVLSNGNGASMHWREILNAIVSVSCDVLAILNCCHAGAAMRDVSNSRPNYDSCMKQVIMASPANASSRWGYPAGFAACLEQALRDRRTNWENTFKGLPEHWAEAINRLLWEKHSTGATAGAKWLVPPPPGRRDQPIVLSPHRSTLC